VQFAIDQQTVASLVVDDKSIADITALEIGTVGENIAVRRAMYLRAATDRQLIASYVHSTGKFYCMLSTTRHVQGNKSSGKTLHPVV